MSESYSLTRRWRITVLTAHVTCSVGWLGSVLCYLALAIVGLTTSSELEMRAAYVDMNRIGWLVIVPLCLGSVATGVLQSGLTTWGYVRHYWILIKLVLSAICTFGLVLHMLPTRKLAQLALRGAASINASTPVREQLIVDAGAAVLVLLVLIALSIVKPAGVAFARR